MKDDILKHLHDIREAALAISRFVSGKTFDDYMHDELLGLVDWVEARTQ